ncbi:MAG: hypothetical protein IPP78_13155 [Holophagaceae bacterium]|nr:hypothetical protein [Holophagaceae bacterium]
MKSLTEMKSALLEWRREEGQALAYTLSGDDGVAATLIFPDDSDTLARLETAEGSWTIKHLGLLNPITTIREAGEKTNIAVFHPHALRHDKLEFADGAVFDWVALHDHEPGGAFLDIEGKPMVRIHGLLAHIPSTGADLDSGLVELGQAPVARWRHAILAAMGWYILQLDHFKENPAHAAEMSLRM